jgi:hypothetical protein
MGATLGRPGAGGARRRRGSHSARREALARATATTRMTHIALQEHLNGKAVDWMEKVSDKQYKQP